MYVIDSVDGEQGDFEIEVYYFFDDYLFGVSVVVLLCIVSGFVELVS